MANNAQKTWLADTLPRIGQKKALEAIDLLGKALPASVASIPTAGVPIVVVKFEVNAAPFTIPNCTVPLFGPEYVRYPVQVGCKGVVFPVDLYTGAVTGLGKGTADLTQQANLSSLVFFPVGNKGWAASDDPNKIVIYGPDGAVVRTADSHCKWTLSADGVVVDLPAGKKYTINGTLVVTGDLNIGGTIKAEDGTTYGGALRTSGDVIAGSGTADEVALRTHTHGGVQGGPSNTNPPNAGT